MGLRPESRSAGFANLEECRGRLPTLSLLPFGEISPEDEANTEMERETVF